MKAIGLLMVLAASQILHAAPGDWDKANCDDERDAVATMSAEIKTEKYSALSEFMFVFDCEEITQRGDTRYSDCVELMKKKIADNCVDSITE